MQRNEIELEILNDTKDWLKRSLEEEVVWVNHLRYIILRRLVNDEKLITQGGKAIPEKDYSKNEIQTIWREMETKTSRGLEKIHTKYLW